MFNCEGGQIENFVWYPTQYTKTKLDVNTFDKRFTRVIQSRSRNLQNFTWKRWGGGQKQSTYSNEESNYPVGTLARRTSYRVTTVRQTQIGSRDGTRLCRGLSSAGSGFDVTCTLISQDVGASVCTYFYVGTHKTVDDLISTWSCICFLPWQCARRRSELTPLTPPRPRKGGFEPNRTYIVSGQQS